MRQPKMNKKKQDNRQVPGLERMVDNQSVYRLLGLANRAGRVIGGRDAVDKAIRQKQACLVIIADDTAKRTNRQIREMAGRENVSVSEFGQKDLLGHWTGAASRAAVAVMDTHFAVRLNELIDQIEMIQDS